MTSDADARYLASIAEDCHRILGPGVELEDLGWTDGTDGVELALPDPPGVHGHRRPRWRVARLVVEDVMPAPLA